MKIDITKLSVEEVEELAEKLMRMGMLASIKKMEKRLILETEKSHEPPKIVSLDVYSIF